MIFRETGRLEALQESGCAPPPIPEGGGPNEEDWDAEGNLCIPDDPEALYCNYSTS